MCEVSIRWKQEFFADVEEIRLKEPLAEFLGAVEEGEEFVFTYTDCIKFAGHSCPTVAGAYKLTQKALKALYGENLPVRGRIKVKVLGRRDEGVNGVMSQIISFITGACPETGFSGLNGKFIRKDKLIFEEEINEPHTFIFSCEDNPRQIKAKFYPEKLPKNEKLNSLFKKSFYGVATEEEKEEFKNLWQERVRMVLFAEIPGLFEIEEVI
ncbi:MAG: FmdE family protein [Candidatus Omnitrophica bacterium]|nr:FmdE family protein [Candidatus Omnitrophota bacterium]MCM8793241.1 FmdE family protein [Candidatus Omnitrophota bacterium]